MVSSKAFKGNLIIHRLFHIKTIKTSKKIKRCNMPNSINIFITNISTADLHKNVFPPNESKFWILSSFLYWFTEWDEADLILLHRQPHDNKQAGVFTDVTVPQLKLQGFNHSPNISQHKALYKLKKLLSITQPYFVSAP